MATATGVECVDRVHYRRRMPGAAYLAAFGTFDLIAVMGVITGGASDSPSPCCARTGSGTPM